MQPRERVAEADADSRRRTIRISSQVADTPHRLRNGAKAGSIRVGSPLAVARDSHGDQAWIDVSEDRGPQAPFLQGARPEVLEQDVGMPDELFDQTSPFRPVKIDRHRLLVAPERPPQHGDRASSQAPSANLVTLNGLLNLDDFSAKVGEEAPRC